MKKVLFFILAFGTFFARGQAPTNGYPPKIFANVQDNRHRDDSATGIPHKYALIQNTTDSTPQIFVYSTPSGDSLVFFVNGVYHTVPSSSLFSFKVDSIKRSGDSVYWYNSGGTKHFAFLDSLGGGGGSGNTNSNIGTLFRLAVPLTNNVKTIGPNALAWIKFDSTTNTNAITIFADSAAMAGYFFRRTDQIPSGNLPTTQVNAARGVSATTIAGVPTFVLGTVPGQIMDSDVYETFADTKKFTIDSIKNHFIINRLNSGTGTPNVLVHMPDSSVAQMPYPSGGGSGGTPAGPVTSVQVAGASAFKSIPYFLSDTLSGTVLTRNQVIGDSIRSGINEAEDTIFFWGYSITLGLPNNTQPMRYSTQVSQAYGSREINKAISGTKLVKTASGDSSLEERMTQIQQYNGQPDRYIFFEYTVNDAAAAVDTNRYRVVWDSIFTYTHVTKGWPLNRIVSITGSLVGQTIANLSPGMPAELIYSGIAQRAADSAGVKSVNMITYMQAHGNFANLNTDSLHPNQFGHNNYARNILPALDSSNYIRTNSSVIEKRLSVQGVADFDGNIYAGSNLSATAFLRNMSMTGNILSPIIVNGGVKIFGDQTIDERKWMMYHSNTGGVFAGYGIGLNPSTLATEFFTPTSSATGWKWGTMASTDSSFSMLALISKTGGIHSEDTIGCQNNLRVGGTATVSDLAMTNTAMTLPPATDKFKIWVNGNTKSVLEFQQMFSTNYWTRLCAPSTAGYGIRFGNKATSDGTTWTDYLWMTQNTIALPSVMLPNNASADSFVVTQTSAVNGVNTRQLYTTPIAAFAKLASPTFTGTPTVPTAAAGTNTTQAASTAYVVTGIANANPKIFAATADASVNNTTTPTSMVGTGVGSNTIAANALVAGSTITFTGSGTITSAATAPTLSMNFKVGSSGNAVSPTIGISLNGNIEWSVTVIVRTTGSSGTMSETGWVSINGTKTYFTTGSPFALNTTISNAIDMVATLGGTVGSGDVVTITNSNIFLY